MSDLTAVSLFAGIEGIGLAMHRAGIQVKAAVEIDADCRGVIALHFPETVLFDDVRTVTGEQLLAAGFVPGRGILAGGWPCQDLSIAGRRAGLGGARSGLFWEIVRLARELRPRWLVLENVDDLLSSACPCPGDGSCVDNRRAVRCGKPVKGEWQDNVQHNPAGGACAGGCMAVHGGAMGAVVGALEQLGYGLCWRVLDAQYAGVPQRRDRLFFAGCLGDGAAPVQVLLEPESSERDFAAGFEAWASAAGDATGGTGSAGTVGTIGGNGPRGGWRVGADEAGAGQLVPSTVISTLQGGGKRGHRIDAEGAAGGQLIAAPLTAGSATGEGVNRPGCRQEDDVNLVPVPVAVRGRAGGAQVECGSPGDPAFTVRTPGGGSSLPMVAYALTSRADRADRADREQTWVTHTLTSEGADASEDGTGRSIPIVPIGMPLTSAEIVTASRDVAQALTANYGKQPDNSDTNLGPTLAIHTSQAQAAGVRRLTPLEEERLQGFPDNWTKYRLENGRKVQQSDSARYRQCGNSVAVPVVEWLAHRLVAVDAAMRASETEPAA